MTPSDTSYLRIPLSQGQFALVDAADYEWLNRWKWNATYNKMTRSFYALRAGYVADAVKKFSMHRMVLGLDFGDRRYGDHINHDTLDNRRSNLRIATPKQSAQNRRLHRDSSGEFIGVHFRKGQGLYDASIWSEGKRLHLGYFSDAEKAAKVRDAKAIELFGEFAVLNFPLIAT